MRRRAIPVGPEAQVRFKNEHIDPVSLVLDYGDFGTVTIIVPINGAVLIDVGALAPDVFIYNAELDIGDAHNVVPINRDN